MLEARRIAGSVSPALLRRYLKARGWLPTQNSQRGFDLFTLPGVEGDDDLEIVMRGSDDPRSMLRSVSDAIETLAQVYERSVEEIVAEVRGVAADIIRNIVPDAHVSGDAISLGLAKELISGFRDFLSSAGTMEINPARDHIRTIKEGQSFADGCRFAHTFRGSFGFVIESPLDLNESPTMLDGLPGGVNQGAVQVPFRRQVIERVARGLEAVEEAGKAEDPSVIVRSFEQGMDAAMCEQLAALVRETNISSLRITINFSPEWPAAFDLPQVPELLVGARQVELLEEASRQLRTSIQARPETILGRVHVLRTAANPADLYTDPSLRAVEIIWLDAKNKKVRVHVTLEPPDYLKAVDAHKAGKMIQVTGKLAYLKHKWHLQEPKDFSVIGP